MSMATWVTKWLAKSQCNGSAVVSPLPVDRNGQTIGKKKKILELLGPENRQQQRQIHDILSRNHDQQEAHDDGDDDGESDESGSEDGDTADRSSSTASSTRAVLRGNIRDRVFPQPSDQVSPSAVLRSPDPSPRLSPRSPRPGQSQGLLLLPPSSSRAVQRPSLSPEKPRSIGRSPPRLSIEVPAQYSPRRRASSLSPPPPSPLRGFHFRSPQFSPRDASPFMSPGHPFRHQMFHPSPLNSSPRLVLGPKLGSGSCGVVYRAQDVDTGQFVAVKILHDESISPQEVALLSHLNHKNIVKYLGTTRLAEGSRCIVLELMSCSLASLLKNGDGLDEKNIRGYTRQILWGLDYLHMKKIVHRDVKCGNILLDVNCRAKLSDFGVSKKLDFSMAKSFKGTWCYMAPEVLLSSTGGEYGLAADIWSLGCTLIEMATAKPPWKGLSMIEILEKVKEGAAPPIPKTLSREAADFVSSCFKFHPKDRPTALDLLRHRFLASP